MRVELQNISKHFGALKANDVISFAFESGRIYAMVGENGAGKSTLMKILSGYQEPTSGQILIDDHKVELGSPNQAITHGIGMLYQDPLDFAPLTVLENYINGRPGGLFLGRRAALNDLQARCKAMGFALNPHALVETLTVGERQQLEIVRLLSLGVQFLILDEPTTGISTEQKTQLFSTLKKLAREQGLTVVLVSHKLEDVEELCDEALVLRRGQLVGHRHLPVSTAEIVELMFGKRIENVAPKKTQTGTFKTVLSTQELRVHARLFSIPQVNLEVHEGEVIGLAGLDGSGQVEFMRTIAGLGRPAWTDYVVGIGVLVAMWLILGELLQESTAVLNLARLTVVLLVLGPALHFFWSISRHYFQKDEPVSIALDGKSAGWRGYRDLKSRGIAYLSAGRIEEGLVSGLTVTAHVALAEHDAKPWINWIKARLKAAEVIKTYKVKGRPQDMIQNLSGGNQQRLAVGILPPDLRVLLMEYPTRGLDVESAQHIWALLLSRREQGTSIIFSSPDLDEVINYSDRILVFSSGKVTLVEDPKHMTTARLGELIGGKA